MKDKTYSQLHAERKNNDNVSYLNYVDLVCIDDIQPENQPWLWPNVIPLDAFTLFAGVGGLGKSQLLMFIVAHISNGKSFQAGGVTHQLPEGAVIILSSEDSQKYAISPRLRALNADTTKIHKIKSVSDEREPFKKRLMALDQDLKLLKKTITDLKENKNQTVKLIIIDPIINFIGKVKDYINTEVSNFLYSLTELAEEFNLSIILNKHLRKKDSSGISSAIDEIAGSHAWVNTARQVWLLCCHPDDKNKILFMDGKSNIKEKITGLAFNIKSVEILNKNNEIIKTSRIEWLDEIITISIDEAINKEVYEKSKIQTTIDQIHQHLTKHGQSLLAHIKSKLIKKGVSEATFRRALCEFEQAQRSNLKITRGIKGAKTYMLIED